MSDEVQTWRVVDEAGLVHAARITRGDRGEWIGVDPWGRSHAVTHADGLARRGALGVAELNHWTVAEILPPGVPTRAEFVAKVAEAVENEREARLNDIVARDVMDVDPTEATIAAAEAAERALAEATAATNALLGTVPP